MHSRRGREREEEEEEREGEDNMYTPTFMMPPSRVKVNFPLNCPSGRSSSYLLAGPRVGNRVRSVDMEGGERGREGGRGRGEGGGREGRWRGREGEEMDGERVTRQYYLLMHVIIY